MNLRNLVLISSLLVVFPYSANADAPATQAEKVEQERVRELKKLEQEAKRDMDKMEHEAAKEAAEMERQQMKKKAACIGKDKTCEGTS
ncbi:hypothetical protein GCE9029_01256 [Grimontia celer]|uniref:Uncharacterized protein n=1 Tax=Grimontia celer TaxID=1796497 RepID=A0A128EYJ0_9GAMM|nr:hypothetical protein [Grimontia celer]CZF79101.1 hypothetical protein GCE9029_01256 [Grimontia celer]